MKRISIVIAAFVLAAVSAHTRTDAQSKAAPATASNEWPTYGHDPGGQRFSPLTQITPENADHLQVAWVYHMRPAPTEASAPAGDAGGQGRGGGRGSGGFASSETTPLVVDGMMYLATPYGRVVALDPTTGKELWDFQLPSGNPSTRGVEYWPGDAQTPPQIVFGSSDGKLYSLDAKTGRAQRLRRQRHRQSEHSGDPAGPAGPQRAELAADRVQEPGHHRRPTQENPPQGPGRRRARVGHAHRQAGVDVPFDSARRREVQRHLGRRQLEEPLRRQRLGLHHRGRAARHRLHAVRRAVGRSVRRRPRRRQSVRHQPRRGRREYRQVPVALPGGASRHLGRRPDRRAGADRREAGRQDDSRRGGRSTRPDCCSCSIASPASRSTASRSGRCRRAKCRWSARRRRSRSRSSRRRSRA